MKVKLLFLFLMLFVVTTYLQISVLEDVQKIGEEYLLNQSWLLC